MKHYKNPLTNHIYGYFDKDETVPVEYILLTDEEVASLSNPKQTTKQLTDNARYKRNMLLKESDWTQLSDISTNIQVNWQTYRQSLRDITTQTGFPENIDWPVAP